ncbi:MAG TPA: peptidyl-prolyl cis-trans isomerase [Armatimonadota bacterium]|nr:peptidyl-prolyl cis-trans isomerase [Armatimonadota bacterium]
MGFPSGGRRPVKAALFFTALTASAGLMTGCGTKPVATVNGTALSEKDFQRLCETATRVAPQQGTVGMQVLQQWIVTELMAQEARHQNVYPSEQDLERRMDMFRKQAGYAGLSMEDELRKQGRTLADFKREQLSQLISENVLFQGVTVSDDEVKKAFDQQKTRMAQPETIEISQITLDSEKAKNEAVADLAGNAQFANVATTRSKDQFAQQGGRVPFPIPRKIPPGLPVAQEVVDAAFKLKPGQVSDPVKVGATWVVVRLEKKNEGKEPRFEDFKDAMRSGLRQQKAQSSGKMAENQRKVMQASASADIKVNRPEYQILVQQFKSAQPPAPAGPLTGAGEAPPAPPGG